MNRRPAHPTGRYSASRGGRSSPSAGHSNPHMIGADGDFISSRNGTPRGRRGYYARHSRNGCTPVYEYRVKKSLGDASSHSERVTRDQSASNSIGSESLQPECFAALDSASQGDSTLSLACSSSENTQDDGIRIQMVKDDVNEGALCLGSSHEINTTLLKNVAQLSLHSDAKDLPLGVQSSKSAERTGDSGNSENVALVVPFNICLPMSGTPVKLKSSLFALNREKRKELKRASEGQGIVLLEPGMVHLKGYLSIDDQVKIVKQCQDLGLGSGGFYQPGYRDGARLLLKMMCLGKNWDPDTSMYGELRPVDGAKPPSIPPRFREFVGKAMKDSIALMVARNVEDILPQMSPDICIVNFYSSTGRLGLHQDKDESEGSLRKGLPVVSFSIGDTCEFLYGDNRNETDAKKVLLESGDVLIFGGKSRLIFHGVCCIHAKTAPKSLLDETSLRPGRLNLTFRQY